MKTPVQLCGKWKGEDLKGLWCMEPKYDGYRARFIKTTQYGLFKTRNDTDFPCYENWNHIAVDMGNLPNGTYDGELLATSYNLTAGILKRKTKHIDSGSLKYHIFDFTPEDLTLKTLFQRKGDLLKMEFGSSLCHVPAIYVTDPTADHIIDMASKFLGEGYEGGVLKKLNSYYKLTRSNDWLKVKFEETKDVQIIGAFEGLGKHQGRLGGFYVCDEDGNEFQVGGGFSDAERERYWNERDTLQNTFCEIKQQADQSETKYTSRFPVFKRLREDREGW